MLLAYASGREFRHRVTLNPPSLPAPRVALRISPHRGESLDSFQARLDEEVGRLRSRLDRTRSRPTLQKGRAPDREKTARQVDWFYRHRLCGESINSISRDALLDRATVRYGV